MRALLCLLLGFHMKGCFRIVHQIWYVSDVSEVVFWRHSLSVRRGHPWTPYCRSKLQKQARGNNFCIKGKDYCIIGNIRCAVADNFCITLKVFLHNREQIVDCGEHLWHSTEHYLGLQETFVAPWGAVSVQWGRICGLWGISIVLQGPIFFYCRQWFWDCGEHPLYYMEQFLYRGSIFCIMENEFFTTGNKLWIVVKTCCVTGNNSCPLHYKDHFSHYGELLLHHGDYGEQLLHNGE